MTSPRLDGLPKRGDCTQRVLIYYQGHISLTHSLFTDQPAAGTVISAVLESVQNFLDDRGGQTDPTFYTIIGKVKKGEGMLLILLLHSFHTFARPA